MNEPITRLPYPWFGGKTRAADLVWARFGPDIPNFIEAFFGGGAVLYNRPGGAQGTETANDKDCYVANFIRATAADPEAVAGYADYMVSEIDLHARHSWLIAQDGFKETMRGDPDFFNAKIAGWWVWGICQWIGSGWCESVSNKLPYLDAGGRGIHRSQNGDLAEYFRVLSARLRRVRMCCGDWRRVLTPSVTTGQGMTGVFLDPPYSAKAGRDPKIYAEEDLSVAQDVRDWAVEHGTDPLMRIALCGYECEHDMPGDWECVEWKAVGGYGNQASSEALGNRHRERMYFSPACLIPSNAVGAQMEIDSHERT